MEYVAAGTSKAFYLSVRNGLSVAKEYLTALDIRSVRYSVFLLSQVPHVPEIEKAVSGHCKVSLDPQHVFCEPRHVFLPCREKINFVHVLPESGESPFCESGRLYLLRYEIVPKFGAKLVFPVKVECY